MSNIEYFAKVSGDPEIRPFTINGESPGEALVLRYSRCNLQCPLCYAWTYAYAWTASKKERVFEIQKALSALNNIPSVVRKRIVWVRIQGGEPCLNYERIKNTLFFATAALQVIYKENLNYYRKTRAIIQTNAIAFSKLDDNKLSEITAFLRENLPLIKSGRIIFEVSFKSPSDQKLLSHQIAGFNTILNKIAKPLWNEKLNNIAVYPVAGLGPSIDFHNTWLVPIDPNYLPEEFPLFYQGTWLPDFANLLEEFTKNIVHKYDAYSDFRANPNTNNGHKIAIEELEPTRFQISWISGYAGKYKELGINVMPVDRILRRLNNDKDRQWYALTNKREAWENVLNSVPLAKNANKLLEYIKDMKDMFYPSHPRGHYPYL